VLIIYLPNPSILYIPGEEAYGPRVAFVIETPIATKSPS